MSASQDIEVSSYILSDVTVFLSLAVFQKIILETLPEVSSEVPIIGTDIGSQSHPKTHFLLSFHNPLFQNDCQVYRLSLHS